MLERSGSGSCSSGSRVPPAWRWPGRQMPGHGMLLRSKESIQGSSWPACRA